jgi:hypothetical protein
MSGLKALIYAREKIIAEQKKHRYKQTLSEVL